MNRLACTIALAAVVAAVLPASLPAQNTDPINGTWKLRVADTQSQDTGTLQCWSLSITQPAAVPPAIVTPPESQTIARGQTAALSVAAPVAIGRHLPYPFRCRHP